MNNEYFIYIILSMFDILYNCQPTSLLSNELLSMFSIFSIFSIKEFYMIFIINIIKYRNKGKK